MDKIGLQLYSLGSDSPLSLLEKISLAGEMGFSGIEFAGGYDDISAEELIEAMKKAGVTAQSAHVGVDAMEKQFPYLAKLGVRRVICPMSSFNTPEEAKELAGDLNRLGKIAAEYGMKTGYHNHTDEFYKVDGRYLYDYLIENTNPEYVEFQIDCGWASAAEIDPVAYINQHAGRICSIHVKENSDVIGAEKPPSRHGKSMLDDLERDENGRPILPPEFLEKMEERDKLNVATGSGIVDWKAVKAAADAQMDNVIYIVEREANYGSLDRASCIKNDIAWIKDNL